jgi:drug/metabolite transporter (DMT)-like permease
VLPLALAFCSAMSWGTADFLAGLAARRQALLVVMVVSQAAGLAMLGAVVLVRGEAPASGNAIAFGLVGGAAGAVGLAALYRALAIGRMGVVAPTAALSGVVPVVWGLARGERPSTVQALGVVLAVTGVVLASRTFDEGGARGTAAGVRGTAAGVGLALVAAAALGLLVVMLNEAGRSDPLWGVFMVRVAALSLLGAALLVRPPRRPVAVGGVPRLVAVGALDNGANVLFALAANAGGLLALTSVVGSLYPVATVLLARVVLRERLERHQALGVVAALVGVALIAA